MTWEAAAILAVTTGALAAFAVSLLQERAVERRRGKASASRSMRGGRKLRTAPHPDVTKRFTEAYTRAANPGHPALNEQRTRSVP
jgi:hypothetical protein